MSALKEIRDRAAAATPGPWQWFGNWDFREVYLATVNYGRRYVLGFRRWGMQGAQPVFRSKPGDGATLQTASEVPIFEVCRSATSRDDQRVYRGDLVGFRNADAEFIASARQDVDDLLARIDAVEAICARHEEGATRWEDPLPMPEWIAEVRGALEGGAS